MVSGGEVLRLSIPEAYGGKTVIGQLTIDNATSNGYVTAYGCADGPPRNGDGDISRSDLNYDGTVSPVASNRLIVQADAAGDVCLYTRKPVAMVVDVNAVTFDTGVTSFPNRRTDSRLRAAGQQIVPSRSTMRVSVPEARGGRTVIGQLTVASARGRGYVTAYGCDRGLPRDRSGDVSRSDLNYNGAVSPVASNRLIVQADDDGDICFYTYAPVAIVVDVNGVTDNGVTSFANRRTDTRERSANAQRIGAEQVLRLSVPEARGGRTVIGQLTVDRTTQRGFVSAYPCDAGLPRDAEGKVARSDLNFDGRVTPVASNRLIVEADDDGDVCVYTSKAASVIVDVNGVSTDAAINSFPNRRVDTRSDQGRPGPTTPSGGRIPVWPAYAPAPALVDVAALTGEPATPTVVNRPIVVGKVDNFRRARPQFAIDRADAVIELNVEGITRLISLFHSDIPATIGPLRSARTADLDLLPAMNRPVLAYSGANPGVTAMIDSAASSGVVVDFSAQHSGCYSRAAGRPAPHNLVLDVACALDASATAGPAQPLWTIDPSWRPAPEMPARPVAAFTVPMDGVTTAWTWDAEAQRYLRTQDGEPHLADSGAQVGADNVVVLEAVHRPSIIDARSPHPETTGTGRGVVHRDGVAIDVTWIRELPYDRFEFLDAGTGAPVFLDRGTTFVQVTRP
jgi:hypothetical protein